MEKARSCPENLSGYLEQGKTKQQAVTFKGAQ